MRSRLSETEGRSREGGREIASRVGNFALQFLSKPSLGGGGGGGVRSRAFPLAISVTCLFSIVAADRVDWGVVTGKSSRPTHS